MIIDPYIKKAPKKSIYWNDKFYFTGESCTKGHTSYRYVINGECLKCSREKWKKAPREVQRIYCRNRRARKKGNGGKHTQQEIIELFNKQKGKCVICLASLKKSGYEADHIKAISRGGDNYISNIQLLCSSCNRRKWAKDSIAFARENGRLL